MSYAMNSNLTIVAFLQNKILTFVLFILLAAIGSVLRWTLQNSRKWAKSSGTFIANIIASFLLGVLLGGSPSGEEVTIEVELEDSPLTSVVRTILEKTKEKSDYRSF